MLPKSHQALPVVEVAVVEDAHLREKLDQRRVANPRTTLKAEWKLIERGMHSSLQTTTQDLKLSKTDEQVQTNVSNPLKNTIFIKTYFFI